MKTLYRTPWVGVLTVLTLVLIATPAWGTLVYSQLWQVGIDNGTQSEFEQEGGTNPPPGSATALDDDWYFAGTYPAPIGTLLADEPLNDGNPSTKVAGFERALTGGDNTDRIHFNLAPEQLNDGFFIEVDTVSSNFTGFGNDGDFDFEVYFNGSIVHSESFTVDKLITTPAFFGPSVGAITGDNVVTLTRTDLGGWMQFDFIRLNSAEVVPEPTTLLIWSLLAGLGIGLGWRRRK